MKHLIIIVMILFALTQDIAAQQQENKPCSPISNWRMAKEYACGYRDYLYGKYYLSNPKNYERNYEKGYDDPRWWRKEIASRPVKPHYIRPENFDYGWENSKNQEAFSKPILKSAIVKLPNEEILRKKLYAAGYGYFAEKTTIVKDLANAELSPLGVAIALETSLSDFAEYQKNPMLSGLMEMNKPHILKVILKEYPGAIEELKKENIID